MAWRQVDPTVIAVVDEVRLVWLSPNAGFRQISIRLPARSHGNANT
jgi:hypothetical protein